MAHTPSTSSIAFTPLRALGSQGALATNLAKQRWAQPLSGDTFKLIVVTLGGGVKFNIGDTGLSASIGLGISAGGEVPSIVGLVPLAW